MTRLVVLVVVGFAVLSAAGPLLALLLHEAVPIVLAMGFVAAMARLVWWLTGRQ